MILKFFTVLTVFQISISVFASTHYTIQYAELSDRYNNGYTEDRYNYVLDQIIELYTPIIEARGGTFHILKDWSDGAVNMWAFKIGNEHWLEIPGGMSRYHLITEEGFLLSVCHEIGHLLGGAPFKGNGDISLEGQADHFAGQSCASFVMQNLGPQKVLEPESEVNEACASHIETGVCKRALSGALSLTSYYAELEKVRAPQISTPTSVVVTKTLQVHPPAQCRLDSFLAGYFKKDRSKCWFKK